MKKTINLTIDGMSCASCVLHVENDIKGLTGVIAASVNLPLKRGEVTFESDKLAEEDIIKIVMKSGYKARLMEDSSRNHEEQSTNHLHIEDQKHLKEKFWKLIVTASLSAILLSISLVWKIDRHMEIMMILSLVIIFYGGREFFLKGIPDLIKGRPAMDTLVALGIGAAFIYSTYLVLFTNRMEEYFMDVAIITTFVLLGRYLEARAKGSAGAAIKKLLELSPKIAHRVMANGEIEEISANNIQIGDVLRVKPGEQIPTDGILTEGYAAIDESMVTGESMPADKVADDKVIGATINGNTAFTMVATKVGVDTVLSQIVKMVQEAQMHKAPIQKLVDVVAGYFVWGVLLVATITFVAWSIVYGGVTSAVFVPTVAVLIIACPCALGLATPISIVVGSGKGAQLGIIIKKTESLEKAHKITAIAFDKTGTITKGHPEVQEFVLLKGKDADAHEIALALEEHSEHPLARSIISYTKTLGVKNRESEVKDFSSQTGFGLNGQIVGKKYYIGNSKYMEQLGLHNSLSKEQINKMYDKGYTVLCLADEKSVIALYGVQDGIKESSRNAIRLLHKRKIKTIMITGDNEKVANAIAKEVGIDEVHSGITPDKKAAIIADLQKQGYFVAMAGDGINDSPAIAKADVGIAMGTGTDVAIETGDLVLVKGDLQKAVAAIELSRATLKNIKQNLFWAFIYNTVGIPLAAFGFLSPAFSAGAMAFSSVSVVLNALRLKRFKVNF